MFIFKNIIVNTAWTIYNNVSSKISSVYESAKATFTHEAPKVNWVNNPVYEAPKVDWVNNPVYEAPKADEAPLLSTVATKDSVIKAISKSNQNVTMISSKELAYQLQNKEFEVAYERKAINKAELVETVQITEDKYLAKALQAKEEQKANDTAIAKVLQEDADVAYAMNLRAKEDYNFAIQLSKEDANIAQQLEQDAKFASALALQDQEDYNFALKLQQGEMVSYINSAVILNPTYNDYDVPSIGNDFAGHNFMVDVAA